MHGQPQSHLHGPASRWAQATLLAVIVFFSLLAMRGLGTAYSYWNDEIFAVFPTTLPWSNLYRHWLLPDVHPPLYNFFLKLWTGVFGVSETLTRIPSMAFAVASILALYRFTRDRPFPARLFALSFWGVCRRGPTSPRKCAPTLWLYFWPLPSPTWP